MVTAAVVHPSLWLLSSQHLQPRLSVKTQICMLILMCGWQLSSFREPKALSRTTPWSVPWAHSFCFLNLTDNAILQLPSQKHESTLNFLNLCLHSLSSLPFPNIKTKSENHYQILNISFLYKAHDHFSYPKPALEQCSSCLWTKLVSKAVRALCGPAPVSLAGLMFITDLFQPLAFLFLKHSEFILLTSI